VAITMNSVKILHAVRSAITAIAELLVYFFYGGVFFCFGIFLQISHLLSYFSVFQKMICFCCLNCPGVGVTSRLSVGNAKNLSEPAYSRHLCKTGIACSANVVIYHCNVSRYSPESGTGTMSLHTYKALGYQTLYAALCYH